MRRTVVRPRAGIRASSPPALSFRELQTQGRQRPMEGWVITAHGTNNRIVDRILARAFEDRPVLIVVAEAGRVFDAGEAWCAVPQGEFVDVVGDVLSEAPRGGDPNRSGVEISDVVVNETRRHGRTQVRQRAGIADVSVEPGDRGIAYGTIVEPHGRDDAEVVVVLGSL